MSNRAERWTAMPPGRAGVFALAVAAGLVGTVATASVPRVAAVAGAANAYREPRRLTPRSAVGY